LARDSYREFEKGEEEEEQQHGEVVAVSSSPEEGDADDRPEPGAFAAALVFDLADALAGGGRATRPVKRKSRDPRTAKSGATATTRDSVPDTPNGTDNPPESQDL
jgi:hypothetical protein